MRAPVPPGGRPPLTGDRPAAAETAAGSPPVFNSRTPMSGPIDIPLSPLAGGHCIGESALAPGDIVVTAGDGFFSGMIRGATGADVSHALVYLGNNTVIEAIPAGVEQNLLTDALTGATLAVALRFPGLTARQFAVLRGFLKRAVGKKYDFVSASDSPTVFCRVWSPDAKFFCSELVVEAYRYAGVRLTRAAPACVTPGDLADVYRAGSLGYVGHLRS